MADKIDADEVIEKNIDEDGDTTVEAPYYPLPTDEAGYWARLSYFELKKIGNFVDSINLFLELAMYALLGACIGWAIVSIVGLLA